MISPTEASALQALDGALSAKVAELGLSGASVALYRPGYERPLLRGFGSMTPDSAIMIASVSKVFVGGAAAKLFELGLATPDDEISYRNPSFPNVPIYWRDLLTHRSSLARDVVGCCDSRTSPAYGRRDGVNPHNPTCPLDDLEGWYTKYLTGAGESSVGGTTEWWNDEDPNAGDYPLSRKWKDEAPGSEPADQYSNLAVGLLGLLIERAAPPKADGSAHSFASFSHEYMFAPLGMTNTAWFRNDLPANTHQVTMTAKSGNGNPSGEYCFIDYPSGQLMSTARDMATWGMAWLEYGKGFLSEEWGREAVACQEMDASGQMLSGDACDFGYLWNRQFQHTSPSQFEAGGPFSAFNPLDLTNAVSHSGSEAGIVSQIIVLPEAGVFAVALLTGGRGSRDLLEVFFNNAPETWTGPSDPPRWWPDGPSPPPAPPPTPPPPSASPSPPPPSAAPSPPPSVSSPPSPSCEDTKGPTWCSKKLQKCHKPAIFRKCAASCGRCGHGACESNSLGGSFCGRKCNTAGKCRNKAGVTKAKCAFCEHSCGAQCAINALGKPLSMAMERGEIVEGLRTAGCVNAPGHEEYCGVTGAAMAKLCTKVKGMRSCFGSCSPQCQGGVFPTNID